MITIAISTTGMIVVTNVTGTPSQPIAPSVQSSTKSDSAMGRRTPPALRKIANKTTAMTTSMAGTSTTRSRSTMVPRVASAFSGPVTSTVKGASA